MNDQRRLSQIGLDRMVRIRWLKQTASLALAGNTAQEIKTILQSDMSGSFRSARTDVRGSLDKTITILLKTWLTVPSEIEHLRTTGLALLRRLPESQRLAVHWGMVMAAYPFWSGVALQVGRLLRLQGTAAAAQVQRRVREQYGERETVSRRTRYVLRSYLDWGVLKEEKKKGIYSAGESYSVDDSYVIAFLIEAFLHSRDNRSGSLKEIVDSPSLFPFSIGLTHAERLLSASPRIEVIRHGLDNDLVKLKMFT